VADVAIAIEQITGLILAGGQGSRMEHRDKGLQPFLGKPLVAHSIARLAPQVQILAINANRHTDDYAAFGLPLWPDLLTGFAGPLAGLHSGLTHCSTEYLAAVPCDSPLLPADLVQRLMTALEQQQADAAFAVTGQGTQQQRHPVFCLLKKNLLPTLSHYLHQDGRKMERWFAGIHSVPVPFEDDFAFSNINTLQELQQLEANAHIATPESQ